MKLLFWNIQRKQLIDEVVELINESNCRIAALAEASDDVLEQVVERLRVSHGRTECASFPTPGCDKIKLIVMHDSGKVALLNQHKNFSLLKVTNNDYSFILGFVHLPSQYSHTLDQIRRAGEILRDQVAIEEESCGITDSIIMGDFNVNPFESPMTSFFGVGATNGFSCSKRENIICNSESKRLFYNPMWTLYSKDREHPGTHQYLRTGVDVLTWHFLDQVIIRPTLIDKFNFDSLRIVKKTTSFNLVNRNSKPNVSDHLPLTCELNIS